jgi:hypothetical protein
VSGDDADQLGDTGSWSFTLTVTPGTLTQGAPVSVTVPFGAGYNKALTVSNEVTGGGALTWTTTSAPQAVTQTKGVINAAPTIPPGTYRLNGTVTDTVNDTGSWSFTVTVNPTVTLTQNSPSPTSATVAASGGYTGRLGVANEPTGGGSITWTTTTASARITVNSTTGAISAPVTTPPGTYTVSGTEVDAFRDMGTWTFTLTVTAGAATPTVHLAGSALPASPGPVNYTVNVTGAAGTPTGVAVVSDNTGASCTITLASGAGACALTENATTAATTPYSVTADYLGDVTYAPGTVSTTVIAAVSTGSGQVETTGSGGVTVTADGGKAGDTVTEFPYGTSDPADTTNRLLDGTSYFDVHISAGDSFSSLTITSCGAPGSLIEWYNGSSFVPAKSPATAGPTSYGQVPSGTCVTVTLYPNATGTPSSAPTISQLTGTIFGIQSMQAQLSPLEREVKGLGPGTSLFHKLTRVQADVAANHVKHACEALNAFINQVTDLQPSSHPRHHPHGRQTTRHGQREQRSRRMTTAKAAKLRLGAAGIRSLLGC